MTVVIADDKSRERDWLKDLLTTNLPECSPIHEASDGKVAADLAARHKPEIVFLDIEMPVMSGIQAAEQIIKLNPLTGIIILSNYADEIWVRQLWKIIPPNGAFGYVLKDATNDQIVEAARSVLSGDCWIHPRIQRMFTRFGSSTSTLTDSEFEVMVYICLGLTDKAIAKRLYVTEKAIQARLKCLYQKFGIPLKGAHDEDEFNHRCRAINIAYRRGLINKAELESWESKIVAQNAPD